MLAGAAFGNNAFTGLVVILQRFSLHRFSGVTIKTIGMHVTRFFLKADLIKYAFSPKPLEHFQLFHR